MKTKKLISAITVMAASITLFAGTSFASSLDKVRFIKIASQDEKAVIKDADGKLRIIKPGDAVCEGIKVVSISAGRIVLEEKTDKGLQTDIVRIENGGQRIERIMNQPDKVSAPVSTGRAQGKAGVVKN